MPASDLDGLKGILLGLGLQRLPSVITSLHKARAYGRNVDQGRAPDDHGPSSQDTLQSILMPLVAQAMQQQGGALSQDQGQAQGGAAPVMPQGPGMRPGLRTPGVPPMPGLPRTQLASTGLGGL
jgi:hypothetical protein